MVWISCYVVPLFLFFQLLFGPLQKYFSQRFKKKEEQEPQQQQQQKQKKNQEEEEEEEDDDDDDDDDDTDAKLHDNNTQLDDTVEYDTMSDNSNSNSTSTSSNNNTVSTVSSNTVSTVNTVNTGSTHKRLLFNKKRTTNQYQTGDESWRMKDEEKTSKWRWKVLVTNKSINSNSIEFGRIFSDF